MAGFEKLAAIVEFCRAYVAGKIGGIACVVRYLRNPNPRVTARLLSAFGASIGRNTTFKGSLYLDNVTRDRNATGDFRHLSIGENCYVGEAVYIDLADRVIVGSNVMLSARCCVVTHSDCGRSPALAQRFPRSCRAVVIGADCWVGANATLLDGVALGRMCVVGANALVKSSFPDGSVVVGVPARRVPDSGGAGSAAQLRGRPAGIE